MSAVAGATFCHLDVKKTLAGPLSAWHCLVAFPGVSMPGLAELAVGAFVALAIAITLFRSAA